MEMLHGIYNSGGVHLHPIFNSSATILLDELTELILMMPSSVILSRPQVSISIVLQSPLASSISLELNISITGGNATEGMTAIPWCLVLFDVTPVLPPSFGPTFTIDCID